ncbi:MAG TPA: phosphohydrolase [Aquabacterium sp.]|nr:phosphohydrolase [Aquabacterium sp.]
MDSSDTGRDVMTRIAQLYEHAGQRPPGASRETITALEQALQCAQLAEWAGADGPLVAAALLHDIVMVAKSGASAGSSPARPDPVAQDLLRGAFGTEVLEPIRLHAAAQRYLLATEPGYLNALPEGAVAAASRQPPMSEAEQQRFEDEPFAPQAVLLRRWIDAEKMPGKPTPSLDYYLALLEEVRERPRAVPRSVVGALDV